jgi:hypothetical protein
MSSQTQPGVAGAEEARVRVKELYRTRGVDVAEDAKNFDSLLRDRFAGQFRRERGTLLAAAQQGLPTRIRRASFAAGAHHVLLAQLADTLRDEAGLDMSSALWVTETFAEILRPELLSPAPARESTTRTEPHAASPEPQIAPPPTPRLEREVAPPPAPPPDVPAGRPSKKPLAGVAALLIALGAIVYHFANVPQGQHSVSVQVSPRAAPPAPATLAPKASPAILPEVATRSCNAPNAADDAQMNTAIARFHQAAVQKDWILAAAYENPTYQGQAGFLQGYAKTAESNPTILKHDGCSVTVALRYKNSDDPQHYCIDQEYTMEYRDRWKIRTAKSISPRTSC